MDDQKATKGSGGAHELELETRKPLLFILDPSDLDPEKLGGKVANLGDAGHAFVRLWVLNHIQCVLVKSTRDTEPIEYRTDYEGCLVYPHRQRPKGKDPWAGLIARRQGKDSEFRFLFSTISLEGLSASDLLAKYGLPGGGKSVPLPGAPVEVVERPYDVQSDASTPPESIIWGKYHVISFPLPAIDEKKLGAFKYWESVLFQNSQYPKIDDARKSLRKSQFTKQVFDDLKTKVLPDVRGRWVAGVQYKLWQIHGVSLWSGEPAFIGQNGQAASYPDLPFLVDGATGTVCGRPSKCAGLLRPDAAGGKPGGPFWLQSSYRNSEQARSGEDIGHLKVEQQIELYDMRGLVTENLPAPRTGAPGVQEDGFFLPFEDGALRGAFQSWKESDEKLAARIRDKVKARIPANLVLRFFHVGMGTDWNTCLLDALNKAALAWKFRTLNLMEDATKNEASSKSLVLDHFVRFSFDTQSDGFSESVAPLHVSQQIAYWWSGLEEDEKAGIRNASYITVRGYVSKAGGEAINLSLRQSRAWKTAQSLWHVLRKEFAAEPWKKTLVGPVEGRSNLPTGSQGDETEVPIAHWGEQGSPIGTHSMSGADTVTVLASDEAIVQKAIEQHYKKFPEDNPEDRGAVVGFHQVVPPYFDQLVRQRTRIVAATPVGAYRVLLFDDTPKEPLPKRMLVYAVDPGWI